jgi:asparagine synthetase A|tara:strand:- start:248 stop:487 length:240 start_codon:yes stop_codon:yes gene_type:complete
MNLFDAVPTVVRDNFQGYDKGESISVKEITNAVFQVIDLCDNFDKDTIKMTTFRQIRLMVSNGVDMLLNDPIQFNEVMF